MVKEDYNKIPVSYCLKCLSLNIRLIEELNNLPYCAGCGHTTTKDATINEWEDLYFERYGKRFMYE